MMATIFRSSDRKFGDDLGVMRLTRSFRTGGANVACATALEDRKVSQNEFNIQESTEQWK
jgi:hypothetical protein